MPTGEVSILRMSKKVKIDETTKRRREVVLLMCVDALDLF